jgi:hypothetical protein
MQYYERPEIYVLKGEEAIEALNNYVEELKEKTPEELTKKQAKVMIKLAKGLIQTIENEPSPQQITQDIPQLFNKLRKTITDNLSKLLQEPSPPTSPPQIISPLIHHLSPPNKQKIQ